MKLLIDASVWSLFLRRKPAANLSNEEREIVAVLTEAVGDGRVAIIGPIRQEMLSGIKEPAQYERLRRALQSYVDEPVTTSDYEEAARLFNVCRSKGVQCGAVVILLFAVARRRQWAIITLDQGLKRCIDALN